MAMGLSWYKQGLLLKKEGKYREAINCFNNALRDDPKDTASIYHKAISLDRGGNLEEAGQTFFQALCLNPNLEINSDSPELWIDVCKLLEKKCNYQTALTLCDKASIRFPTNVEFIKQREVFKKILEKHEIKPINSENIIEKPKNSSTIEKSKEISEHEPAQIKKPSIEQKP